MQRADLAIPSFCDVLPELAPTVGQILIVGLEEWRGLVLTGNGLSGVSPTDIPLVDNRREKCGKILNFRLLVKNSRKSDPAGLKRFSAEALLDCG